jgi:exoribonuclease II
MNNSFSQNDSSINPFNLIRQSCAKLQIPASSAIFAAHEHDKQKLQRELASLEAAKFQIKAETLTAISGLVALEGKAEPQNLSYLDLRASCKTHKIELN